MRNYVITPCCHCKMLSLGRVILLLKLILRLSTRGAPINESSNLTMNMWTWQWYFCCALGMVEITDMLFFSICYFSAVFVPIVVSVIILLYLALWTWTPLSMCVPCGILTAFQEIRFLCIPLQIQNTLQEACFHCFSSWSAVAFGNGFEVWQANFILAHRMWSLTEPCLTLSHCWHYFACIVDDLHLVPHFVCLAWPNLLGVICNLTILTRVTVLWMQVNWNAV